MSRFFGGLLVAIGVLLAGTTGLCTGAVILFALPGLISQPGQALSASPLLLVGIIPCAIGVLITRAGLSMIRSDDRDPPRD